MIDFYEPLLAAHAEACRLIEKDGVPRRLVWSDAQGRYGWQIVPVEDEPQAD